MQNFTNSAGSGPEFQTDPLPVAGNAGAARAAGGNSLQAPNRMKAIFSMTIVALFSTALAGCWFYSRPDAAGCQKTTYGVAIATTSSENCPPADAGKPPPPAPSIAPPLPPPSMP